MKINEVRFDEYPASIFTIHATRNHSHKMDNEDGDKYNRISVEANMKDEIKIDAITFLLRQVFSYKEPENG
ncbi:TPA: hypothetical protein G8M64_005590 [Salmonella enterica]|nr:hypothetical protein [Salmonella enterica]EJA7721924.1 hypothetical protein [Salmonella enterica]HAF1611155.1 hypothetical protein [Salmonella enterica]